MPVAFLIDNLHATVTIETLYQVKSSQKTVEFLSSFEPGLLDLLANSCIGMHLNHPCTASICKLILSAKAVSNNSFCELSLTGSNEDGEENTTNIDLSDNSSTRSLPNTSDNHT